ncbi:hypothetical protein BJX66DRAFT_302509 [Aspergillus keveii]|uniref:Uncharacterized protein n=1 Tax=Aspergillus keveii TaxID=714993 RepID=A0ABR4G7P0_9EURO
MTRQQPHLLFAMYVCFHTSYTSLATIFLSIMRRTCYRRGGPMSSPHLVCCACY